MLSLAGLFGCTLSSGTEPLALLFSKLFHIPRPSIVPACSTAARPAPSETAKAASTLIIASTTSATKAAAPPTSSHQISEKKEDQAGVAGLDEKEKDQEDDAAAEENLHETDLNRRLLAVVLMNGLGDVQRDAGVGGDDAGDLLHAERDSRVVVALAEGRNHRAADVAHLGVVEDALEPVADFDPIFSRIHYDDHQDAAVRSLLAYLPLLFESGGELVYRLIAIHRLDRDNRDLGVRLAIDLGTEIFKIELGGRSEDVGKIADIARGRRKSGDRFGRHDDRRSEDQKDYCQPP